MSIWTLGAATFLQCLHELKSLTQTPHTSALTGTSSMYVGTGCTLEQHSSTSCVLLYSDSRYCHLCVFKRIQLQTLDENVAVQNVYCICNILKLVFRVKKKTIPNVQTHRATASN